MVSIENSRLGSQLRFCAVIMGLASFAGVAAGLNSPLTEDESTPLAIEHVTVLPMTKKGPQELHDATVLIRAGRIVSISLGAQTPIE